MEGCVPVSYKYVPGLRLVHESAAVPPLSGASAPKLITRPDCFGGTKGLHGAPVVQLKLPFQVVTFCVACEGLGTRFGVPKPPPNCPRTTSEVGVGRLLVRLMGRVAGAALVPALTMMVGPGIQPAVPVVAQGFGSVVFAPGTTKFAPSRL